MNEIEVYEEKPLTITELKDQVGLIQQVMKEVMREGEHYGVIPGCGDKPALLKPGAEKLIFTFRLVPDPQEEIIELPNGHREYRYKIKLYTRGGVYLGAGVGSCSTMEGKYRYRNDMVMTETPVPKEYWDLRKANPEKAKEMIGGKGHAPKKNDLDQWVIAVQGDKIEHDNPADYYNTCQKMGKKRALVDACLTVTAASDIFTQDIEEMTGEVVGIAKPGSPAPIPQRKSESGESHTTPSNGAVTITDVSVTSGVKADKTWKRYKITTSDGTIYSTFSDTLGTQAGIAKEVNAEVIVKGEKGQYGYELKELLVVPEVVEVVKSA